MSLLHSHTASKTHRQDPDLPAPPHPPLESMLFLIPRESSEQRGRPRPCVPELQLQASRGGVSGRSPEPLAKRELQIRLPLPPASESGDSGTLTLQTSMVLAWSRTALALLNESPREKYFIKEPVITLEDIRSDPCRAWFQSHRVSRP